MQLSDSAVGIFTHIAQGLYVLAFAMLLRHYFQSYKRQYLRYWSFAAAIFGSSELLRFAADVLPADAILAIKIASVAALALLYLAIAFLMIGVLDIIKGDVPAKSARKVLYYGSALAGVMSVLAFTLTPALVPLQSTLGVSSRFALTGIILVIVGIMIVRAAPASFGPRLIATSFFFIGLKNIGTVALLLAPLTLTTLDELLAIEGLVNLLLIMTASIGVIIWLLESERSNSILAIQRAEYLNTHDVLTGLENRDQLVNKIPVFIDYCRAEGRHLTIVLLSINRFKAINDNIGIRGGDRVLMELANRLEQLPYTPLATGRLSGDVFAVTFDHLKRRSAIAELIDDINRRLSRPMLINEREVNVSCAFGVVRSPQHGSRADTLINKATIALAHAKESENTFYMFYERGMHEPYGKLVDIEAELRNALRKNQFVLYYQPIMDLRSGQLSSFEALIRWQHPTRGLLGPNEFLPYVEQLGLAVEVDDWVLRHCASQLQRWQQQLGECTPIAVNLSARHFQQPNLIEKLTELLRTYQITAPKLHLEITENVAMSDMKTGTNVLAELKAMNFTVAIDDFGTGYSSLAYLRRLPVEKIKIDRSFIADMLTDDGDTLIVKALIRLAHGLGKIVVAEGVESEQQKALLLQLGCDRVQGYYYSPPVALAYADELLHEWRTQQRHTLAETTE